MRGRLNRENPLGVTQPDGTPGIVEQTQFMVTNKVSSQITRSQRFVFFDYYQRLIKDDPVTVQQGYDTKQNNYQPQHTTKVEWQGVKGNSLVASLQVSRWRVHVTQNIRGTGPEKNDIGIRTRLERMRARGMWSTIIGRGRPGARSAGSARISSWAATTSRPGTTT